jgi:hypothetical protein
MIRPHVRRRLVLAAFVVAVAVVIGCSPDALTASGQSSNGQVSWLVRGQQIEVTNETTDTMRYTVVGRAYFHASLSTFCFGSPTCALLLPPKLTGLLSYIDISGSAKPETEAMVVYWKPKGTAVVAWDTVIARIR